MSARTPEDAVEAFLDPLRQAALCITHQPFLASGYRPSKTVHVAAFAPHGAEVPLDSRFGRNSIALFVSIRYRIVEETDANRRAWQVVTAAYDYSILDREGGEILVYHWHPADVGPSYEHLHLSGSLPPLNLGRGRLPVPLGDMHIPTNHMSLGAIVHLLIDEFGVPPLKPDHVWREIVGR